MMSEQNGTNVEEFREFRLPETFPSQWLPFEVRRFIRAVHQRHVQRPVSRRALKTMAKDAGLDPEYTDLDELGLVGLRLDCRGHQIPLIVRFEVIAKSPRRCEHTIDMFGD